MFGFIRSSFCKTDDEKRELYHFHNCGICKTIGKNYNNWSRFFLDSDIVFMSQLITSLDDNCEKTKLIDTAYKKKNCFKFPESEEGIPITFKYFSAINIVMIYLKIIDNIRDNNSYFWQFIKFLYLKSYNKAKKQLINLEFPLNRVIDLSKEQGHREDYLVKGKMEKSPEELIDFLAEPTAIISAMIFSEGSKLVNRSDVKADLYKIGLTFGKSIYLLDAIEDYEKDMKAKKFNALQAIHNWETSLMPEGYKKIYVIKFSNLCDEIKELLLRIDLPEKDKHIFIEMLKYSKEQKMAELNSGKKVKNYNILNILKNMYFSFQAQEANTFNVGGPCDLDGCECGDACVPDFGCGGGPYR